MGAGNRAAIGTLVQRSTRLLILLAFPDAVGSAEAVREAISTALERLPEGLRRTLTWDQGKELALHQQIAAATGAGVFFCEAHSPWQRASNENMNGLLRDYFPKGTDLVHTVKDITWVAAEMNQRPRKMATTSRPVQRGDRGLLTGPLRTLAVVASRPPADRSPGASLAKHLPSTDQRGARQRTVKNVNGTVKVRLGS